MLYESMNIVMIGDYPAVYMPEHHKASSSNGCVYIHVLVAEKKLGRELLSSECVHHVNEDKNDYSDNNIWIFKSKSDHALYHSAMKNNLDHILTCKDGVYECKLCDYVCPKCGNKKSFDAKYCLNCTNRVRRSRIPDKHVLEDMLKSKNYTEIGKIYGVSSNSVKKWAKKYGLYKSQNHSLPDKFELENLLKHNSRRSIAKYYNVNPDVVKRWEKLFDIDSLPLNSVICIETNEIFEDKQKASLEKYSDITPMSGSNAIRESCKSGNAYKGYHWRYCRR